MVFGRYRRGMEFTEAQRALQDRFNSRRIADRINELLVQSEIDEDARRFIEQRDMMFVASVDANGQPTCSYKGGDPGFVRVIDERTLAFPWYDGNGMFLTLGNASQTGQLGLLFIDFTSPSRLRVHGRAHASAEDPLVSTWPGAQLVVRVDVTEVFPNCPRYIHRMETVERSEFVPHDQQPTPVPEWKQSGWARGYLPEEKPPRSP